MYPVSNAYLTEILKNDRQTDIYGTITLSNGTVIDLDKGSFAKAPNISNQCSSDSELILGQVYQGQLSFTFYSDISRYLIYGAAVELTFALYIPSEGEWEEVPLGVYYVSECIRQGLDKLKVTCFDHMDALDEVKDSDTIVGTPYEILNYISVKTGVTLGQTEAQIRNLPNGEVTFGLPSMTSIQTYRDILRDLSACMCGFGTIGRDGKLYIMSFATASSRTISADHRGNDTISDYQVIYSAVGCTKNGILVTVGSGTNQMLDLGDNEFLQLGTNEYTTDILNNILSVISELQYTPSQLSLLKSDPSYDLGDLVAATGYTAGTSISVPVHKLTWSWGAGAKIEAVGKDPNLGNVKTKDQKRIENQIDRVATIETGVMAFTNMSDVSVTSDWSLLGHINAALSASKPILLNGVVKVDMDSDGSICIKYSLNDEEDDFIHVYQAPAGIHTITLFINLSGALPQFNSIKVYIKSSDALGFVEALGFRGAISAPGLITPDWDGLLEAEDTITAHTGGSMHALGISEDVGFNDYNVDTITASDVVTAHSGGSMHVLGISEDVALYMTKNNYDIQSADEEYQIGSADGEWYLGSAE